MSNGLLNPHYPQADLGARCIMWGRSCWNIPTRYYSQGAEEAHQILVLIP